MQQRDEYIKVTYNEHAYVVIEDQDGILFFATPMEARSLRDQLIKIDLGNECKPDERTF